MYNTDFPQRADLPSAAQLKKSTMIAAAVAAGLLVTVILPADYAVDPTGIGRALGLTRMGEIKVQLAEEARKGAEGPAAQSKEVVGRLERIETRLASLEGLLSTGARSAAAAPPSEGPRPSGSLEMLLEERARRAAPEAPTGPATTGSAPVAVAASQPPARAVAPPPPAVKAASTHRFREDNVSVKLAPGEGAEFKMTMKEGSQVQYNWAARGGATNYDLHGTPTSGGPDSRYKMERGVSGDSGVLTAGFDGAHGWFFRNRGDKPLEIVLYTGGNYGEMKRVQ